MAALIAGSAIRTCFGDGDRTFDALLRGTGGAAPLRFGDPGQLNVSTGYHAEPPGSDASLRASRLLSLCVREAAAQAGIDTAAQRVVALVGTGLRELAAVEDQALTGTPAAARALHFTDAVTAALPGVAEVVTVSNACSAGGHALALAQDMVELGLADAVLACGTDAMTRSMLAMIGRVAPEPTTAVRPFDRDRTGVLLGEGAAVAVVVPESWAGPALGRLEATGLSCDAFHETAPDPEGIARAMTDAYERAGVDPSAADLVVAHGTGTALNDPAECEALRKVLVSAGADPLVTAVKGAIGHTSGSAALVNVDVALRCLARGAVPPVTGLRQVLPEGAGLRFVTGGPVPLRAGLVQVNAFGFGGVNAVTLVGRS